MLKCIICKMFKSEKMVIVFHSFLMPKFKKQIQQVKDIVCSHVKP